MQDPKAGEPDMAFIPLASWRQLSKCDYPLICEQPTSGQGFPDGLDCERSAGMKIQSLGQEEPLEKEMATHSSIFAWRIPWKEEPDGLQSMGSQRVRHD